MNDLKSFTEFRAEISIIELATANGYCLDRSAGLKWPVLKNEILGDKIIITNAKNPANQGYWNVHDEKDRGTLITFVKNRLGSLFSYNSTKSDISNINAVLYNYLNLPIPERNSLKKVANKIVANRITVLFKVPESIRVLDNPAYLHFRRISDKTIKAFSPTIKNLRSGPNGKPYDNIAFPYFDGQDHVVGLEIRNKQFRKMQSGSNRSIGVWHSPLSHNWNIKNVILTESPIDALSYFQLKGKKYPIEDSLYVAFGGTVGEGQLKTVREILSKHSNKLEINTFVTAFDNDEMGKSYSKKVQLKFGNVVEDFPIRKDYNEDLKVPPIACRVNPPMRR